MIDASGAGDVDTSTIVTANDGIITGLTGRKLRIPIGWNNPSGNYHIGVKNIFELYPKELRERIINERKEKEWDPAHNRVKAQVARQFQEFDKKNPSTTQLTAEQKLEKEEFESQTEILKNLDTSQDYGPVYDCIVFHDGTMWRAVIDTSGCGDLDICTLLGPYRETLKYATISKADMLNYSINVHEEGNVLEIVANTSCHGTHVASIATGNFPEEPDLNGIAPGAQIISICIGDSRISGMETGTALTRAVIKVAESKCDVINMSYGEMAHWNSGHILDMIQEVVHTYGVVMVTSAGNQGPALSTVNSPPTMKTLSVIGVGAYVSPEMMLTDYSLREKLPGMGYTWTSRGPSVDGDFGVSICAPGGAIASLPNWTLQFSDLKNGTSMSSPHVAGACCVLISGMKEKGLPYSPYSIHRAVKATALKVPTYDVYSMGHGLLQVEKAFDWLLNSVDCLERDLVFRYSCSDKNHGIYLRESHELIKPAIYSIKILPMFLNNLEVDPNRKIDFSMQLNLVCESAWVSCPTQLCMTYNVRSIGIKVDPTGLDHGAHFTSVRAYDCKNVEKGPVFEIPITVIKPKRVLDEVCQEICINDLVLTPGSIHRQFIEVPTGATWAVFKARSCDATQAGSFILHALQLVPQHSPRTHEYEKFFTLDPQCQVTHKFKVKENRTLEVCFAKWWSSIGEVKVNISISFHGLKFDQSEVTMQHSGHIHRVDVSSSLRKEEFNPEVALKSHVIVLRPTESKVQTLGLRDVIPKGRQIYELQLTYTFNISKATDILVRCPYLSEFLYESEYESQMWMLFDCNKRFCASGDAFPKRYSTKVEKGDYTLRMQVRHEQKSQLEKLSEALLEVVLKLPNTLYLETFWDCSVALAGGKKNGVRMVNKGDMTPIFITHLPADKLPKGIAVGHYLSGTIVGSKSENGRLAPDCHAFKYIVSELPKKVASPKPAEKTKSPEEEYSEAIRDAKISWITKLQGKASEDLYKELNTAYPLNPSVLLARIQFLDSDKERPIEALQEIVKLSNDILDNVDCKDLLASTAAKNSKKENNYKAQEKLKGQVIETLNKKGAALCDLLELPEETNEIKKDTSVTLEKINEVYTELQKWIDVYDAKVSHFVEKHGRVHKHYGRAIKSVLNAAKENKPTQELDKSLIELYEKLGWEHCKSWAQNFLTIKYPPAYRLF